MGIRSDLVLCRTAVNRGYPIPPDMRAKMVELIQQVQDDPLASNREKLAANRLLLSADMANETINKNDLEINALLMLAEQHGITDDVLRLVSDGEGSDLSTVDPQP